MQNVEACTVNCTSLVTRQKEGRRNREVKTAVACFTSQMMLLGFAKVQLINIVFDGSPYVIWSCVQTTVSGKVTIISVS